VRKSYKGASKYNSQNGDEKLTQNNGYTAHGRMFYRGLGIWGMMVLAIEHIVVIV